MMKRLAVVLSLLVLPSACTEEVGLLDEDTNFGGRGGEPLKTVMDILDRAPPPANPLRNAYFGDLHVHTEYSFDAYNFGTTATPYDAYRFAQGQSIEHPAGYQIQMATPLDFYAVTDHAMFLGLARYFVNTKNARTIRFVACPSRFPDSDSGSILSTREFTFLLISISSTLRIDERQDAFIKDRTRWHLE